MRRIDATRNDPIPEYVEDVWEAEFLRTFEGSVAGDDLH